MYIRVTNVVKKYAARRALDDISFSVQKGQFVALLGPSGCGKTTLLQALAGFVDLDDGKIERDSVVISAKGYTMPPEERRIGMVFQDFALWPHMTVFDNVAFGLKMQRVIKADILRRVGEVLETVHMTGYERYFPHQLSGGQKQRIAIARALAPSPEVLLMDEPLSSLDAKLREEMRWEILRIVHEADITTIYVTHDQMEALSMADHIVVMNQGKVEQEGSAPQLYHEPASVFAADFLGASNLWPGVVVAQSGDVATVDCGGVAVEIVSHAAIHTHVTVMIRPTDIVAWKCEASGTESNHHGLDWHGTTSGTLRDGFGVDAVSGWGTSRFGYGAGGRMVSGLISPAYIKRRAFLGSVWQYYMVMKNNPHLTLEVRHNEEWYVGDSLKVMVPRDRCHALGAVEGSAQCSEIIG